MKSAAAGKKWGGVAGSAFFVIFADVMRKLFSRYALSAIVAPLLAVGCNDGVFIDDFLPEAPSVTVGPDDTSATIRFEAGNWDILSVEGPTTSLRGDIYDAEGNLLYGNHPLYGDGLLRMTYDDGLLDFGIERNDYRTLRITLGESLRDEPWETRILVGNDYESETVSVTFAPTEKYRVDSVVYRWDEFESWDNSIELQDAFTIDNTASSEPASVVVSPFRNAKRTVRFWPDDFNDRRRAGRRGVVGPLREERPAASALLPRRRAGDRHGEAPRTFERRGVSVARTVPRALYRLRLRSCRTAAHLHRHAAQFAAVRLSDPQTQDR